MAPQVQTVPRREVDTTGVWRHERSFHMGRRDFYIADVVACARRLASYCLALTTCLGRPSGQGARLAPTLEHYPEVVYGIHRVDDERGRVRQLQLRLGLSLSVQQPADLR